MFQTEKIAQSLEVNKWNEWDVQEHESGLICLEYRGAIVGIRLNW